MNTPSSPFTAIVLAADRESNNPVAEAAGTACKSLAPVGGTPMVLRVLDALDKARHVDAYILSGPAKSIIDAHEDLRGLISSGRIQWMQNQSSPSTSTLSALKSLTPQTPVLVTTADHALLSSKIVDHFCSEALKSGCDVVAALALYDQVLAAFPDTRRTATKLSDARYCSCNLFAFLTPKARKIAELWRQVEHQRKKPWRIINLLGWPAVLRYVIGRLSLSQGLKGLSRRLGVDADAVILPFPEAAVDVDTVDDWKFVENIINRKQVMF
jgi:GTP:adenosylcobinamide-phosphate guanylyltransferase